MNKYVYFSQSLQCNTCSLYKCYMKRTNFNMYTSLLETVPNKGQQVKYYWVVHIVRLKFNKLKLFLLSFVGVKLKSQVTGIEIFEDRMLRI